MPSRTRTLQVIEAITGDVSRIPYIYNTDALAIDLIQGCSGLGERFTEGAVRRRMENVDIRVEFDPGMLPRYVWWAVWDGVAGNVIS